LDHSSQPCGTPTDRKRLTESQAGWQAAEWLDIDDTVGRAYNEISSLMDFGTVFSGRLIVSFARSGHQSYLNAENWAEFI
jgi:hypothetical protein